MDIQVEIHLSYDTDVWAYGMVTLEDVIRFPIQLRKYKNKDTGEETSFLAIQDENVMEDGRIFLSRTRS